MASAYHLSRKLQKEALTALRETRLPQVGKVGGNAGIGEVFYVNASAGSDSGAGTQDSPYATIVYALTKCTDRNDDTILVTRDPSEDSYPVTVNKRDIHIYGWDNPTRQVAEKVYFNSSGAAGFKVTAQNVEIAGFDFVANNSYSGIELTTNVWNTCIHDCNFGMRGDTQYGILFNGGGVYASVYDCYFGTAINGDGIRFDANAFRSWIGLPGHGNIFDVDGIGVHGTSGVGVTIGGICDNIFLLASDTVGYAISFVNSGAAGCIVNGNSAFYDTAPMSTNPYRDLGTNHWGLNYRQGLSILPVTA